MSRSAGFSLIELMMVLVLVAIFSSIAVPSFNALIERNRIQTASEDLYSLLQYARSEAVNRHANVSIRATQNNDWAKGLEI
ncbi:UNVERIFIED_CONTAM: GspH/FimT family pseudopilin, partial [Pseudomonas aeruginosa]